MSDPEYIIGTGRVEIESWASAQQQPNGAQNNLAVGVQVEESVYVVCKCDACGGEQQFVVRAIHNCPTRKTGFYQQIGSLIRRTLIWLHIRKNTGAASKTKAADGKKAEVAP